MKTVSPRSLALIISAMFLAIALVTPVYAHANLVRSDPPANSILPTSPQKVTLYFTEQLEPKLSGGAVYDSSGKEVDTGYSVSPTDATVLTITLPTLSSGVYTVSWHAISAVDGHHTSGSFSFGIGNVTIPTQSSNNAAYVFPSGLEVFERWVNLVADVVLLGSSIFILVVWNPMQLEKKTNIPGKYADKVVSRISKLAGLAGVLAVVATILLLIVEALAAAPSTSLTNVASAAYAILTSTRIGELWVVRFIVAVFAAVTSVVLLPQNVHSRGGWILSLIIGLMLSLSTSITSHNAASSELYPALNLTSDWFHIIAVSGWIGGLTCLLVAIISIRTLRTGAARFAAGLLRRFSSVAIVCVGVIGITGTYNLLIEVGSLTALFTTQYGEILLAKVAIFIPMIVLGAINQFIVYSEIVEPRPKSKGLSRLGRNDWLGKFRLSVRTEATLGIILLLVVGVLTASAPVAQAPYPPHYQPSPTVFNGYSSQGVNVTLKVYPFQVGSNHFEIAFTTPEGVPLSNIRSVFVKFTYLDGNLGASIANATAQSGSGIYYLDGTYLSLAGNWKAEVWAQRSDAFDVIVPFQFSVPPLSLRFSELPLSTDANPYGIAVDQAGVVWFAETGSGNLARYEPTNGTFAEFPLPQAGSRPFYLAIDRNDAIWMTETQYDTIVMFNPTTNTFKQYQIPTPGAVPGGIAADQFGNIWFTEEIGDKVGKLDTATGNITEFQILTPNSIPIQIAVDAKQHVWFTESKVGKIGTVNPSSGAVTEYQPQNATLLGPTGLTITPDGRIWFTEHAGNRITSFEMENQTFHSYLIPTPQAFPFGIAYHAGGLWFVEHIANALGRFDLATGTFSNYQVPNNSSDAQLLSVDQSGNVWFTLPATNVLGVLTPTTSSLQLESNSTNSEFYQLAMFTITIIAVSTIVALILSQQRMKRKIRRG